MLTDLANNIQVKRGLSPAVAVTNDTAFVSEILDCRDYSAVAFVALTGSLADANATFTTLIEEGAVSNLSDAAAVADGDLNGTEALASFTFAADNKVFKLGYKGIKRYVRVTITPASNTGDVYIAGVWVCTPKNAPPVNPPA